MPAGQEIRLETVRHGTPVVHGLVHLDQAGLQGEVERRLVFPAVGRPAVIRIAERVTRLPGLPQSPVVCAGAQDTPFEIDHGQARGQVEGRGVAPVAVDDQDALESVIGQAAADVADVVDESVPPNGDRPVEIHVVGAVTVGHRRGQNNLFRYAGRGAPADLRRQDHVDVHGQVGTVVFVGRHRQDGNPVPGGRIPNFVPDHFRVVVLDRSHCILLCMVPRLAGTL